MLLLCWTRCERKCITPRCCRCFQKRSEHTCVAQACRSGTRKFERARKDSLYNRRNMADCSLASLWDLTYLCPLRGMLTMSSSSMRSFSLVRVTGCLLGHFGLLTRLWDDEGLIVSKELEGWKRPISEELTFEFTSISKLRLPTSVVMDSYS